MNVSGSAKHRCYYCDLHKEHNGCVLPEKRQHCDEHKECKQEDMCSITRALGTISSAFAEATRTTRTVSVADLQAEEAEQVMAMKREADRIKT